MSIHGECFDREGDCSGCSILTDGDCKGDIESVLMHILPDDEEEVTLELAELYDKRKFLEDYLKKEKGAITVNKKIIELYPKTEDAVLINEYFEKEFESNTYHLLIKGKEKELLALANELKEREENDIKILPPK